MCLVWIKFAVGENVKSLQRQQRGNDRQRTNDRKSSLEPLAKKEKTEKKCKFNLYLIMYTYVCFSDTVLVVN